MTFKSDKSEVPFCRDCRHCHISDDTRPGDANCGHPKAIIAGGVNVVTGERAADRLPLCWQERGALTPGVLSTSGQHCGYQALWFEPASQESAA